MANPTVTKTRGKQVYPLISGKERLAIVRKLRGIWKHRKPDPIKELEQMRKEWDRDISL